MSPRSDVAAFSARAIGMFADGSRAGEVLVILRRESAYEGSAVDDSFAGYMELKGTTTPAVAQRVRSEALLLTEMSPERRRLPVPGLWLAVLFDPSESATQFLVTEVDPPNESTRPDTTAQSGSEPDIDAKLNALEAARDHLPAQIEFLRAEADKTRT